MFFENSRIKLFYQKTGSGKPLIMLHGNGETHAIFSKAVAELENRFTVYAIDSRGHGKSSTVSEYHYEDMVQDIYDFICTLEIEKPVLYGFSDGGIVALLTAIKYPDLLSCIVVSGVNSDPSGLKNYWLNIFRVLYFFTRSTKLKMLLEEPDITGKMLQTIDIPVYITAGSKDMIKQDHLEYIADNIKHSQLKIFADESHGSYIINNKKIAEYILDIF